MPSTGVTRHHARAGGLHPCVMLWVSRLREAAYGLTEDPKNWGYRPSGLWGQWQLQSVSSIGDGNERSGSKSVGGKRGKA